MSEKIILDRKQFVSIENEHGVASNDTLFHYSQNGEQIYGSYAGGKIVRGEFLGLMQEDNTMEMLYHCITEEGKLLGGEAKGKAVLNDFGKVELFFEWRWLYGANGNGVSRYGEL